MQAPKKRKINSSSSDSHQAKKKKGGNHGKWQTPHHQAKTRRADQQGFVEPGDSGIWVTCARSQEAKAAREVQLLFDEYAEKLYHIKPSGDAIEQDEAVGEDDEVEKDDIEATIQKELSSLKPGRYRNSKQVFTVIRQNVDCLLFVKARAPVEPVGFVHRICEDAGGASSASARRCRYLNRLTPITLVGKASERGVQEVCEKVLPNCFRLKVQQQKDEEGDNDEKQGASGETGDDESKPAYSYAIRATTRNQCPLKREDVIKQIASMIDDRHQVNLGRPDKVILVDMYQTLYGMSVVDGDWEALRRYNITELYSQASKEVGDMMGDGKDDQE